MSYGSRSALLRASTLIAVAAAAFGVAACGSSSSSGGGKGKPNMAMVTADTEQNAFQEMTFGAQVAAGVYGISLKTAAPTGINNTEEVNMFDAATQSSKDGVAAMTTAPSDFLRPFQTATSSGVPVVAVDAAPLPGSNVKWFVGNSNTDVGSLMTEQVIKKIPANATGYVVIGNDIPGLPLLQDRINGMIKVLKAQRPGLKILGPYNVTSDPTSNYDAWVNVVKAHPNAVAYLAPGDQDAVSMFRIEKSTGKHYLVGACDVDPTALQSVKQGYVDALGDPHHFLKGFFAMYFLYEHWKGHSLPSGWFNPGAGVITSANINSIIARERNNQTRYAWYKPIIQQELSDISAHMKPISDAN